MGTCVVQNKLVLLTARGVKPEPQDALGQLLHAAPRYFYTARKTPGLLHAEMGARPPSQTPPLPLFPGVTASCDSSACRPKTAEPFSETRPANQLGRGWVTWFHVTYQSHVMDQRHVTDHSHMMDRRHVTEEPCDGPESCDKV